MPKVWKTIINLHHTLVLQSFLLLFIYYMALLERFIWMSATVGIKW